jgi:hypothetical protein
MCDQSSYDVEAIFTTKFYYSNAARNTTTTVFHC